jgi:hypothetical protein
MCLCNNRYTNILQAELDDAVGFTQVIRLISQSVSL